MKVSEFNQGTSYNGILPTRPDMSEDKVLIRKLKMYSILFFVLFILFLITTIIVSVILGINIKNEQMLEEELETCVKLRDSFFFKSHDPPISK
uniref:Col_cuticle_N domain-containing protein n=1 Tax=Caenorhabditis tropicalis TaxID=1561998 RepID=A0A1I7UNH1_9PELO